MKKIIILLFVFTAMLNSNLRAATVPEFSTGYSNVCPNTYGLYSCTNLDALNGAYAIRFQCGGAGSIQVDNYSDNPQNLYFVRTNGYLPSTCVVYWTSGNGTNSWVTITVYYHDGHVPHTFPVTFGIQASNPGTIITDGSICASFSGNKTASCNSLPAGATGYEWYSPNATITGNGQTITYNVGANTSDVILMVRYISVWCGTLYSNWSSVTIPRSPGAPTQTPGYTAQEEPSSTTFTFSQAPRGTAFEASNGNASNWYSFSGQITVIVNKPKTLYVRSVNDCGAGPAGYYYLKAYGTGPYRLADTNEESSLENSISIYPTLSSDNVTVSINSDATATYSISLRDALGKQVRAITKAVQAGANQSDMDVSKLKNGVYFLNITDGINVKNEKIIVAH